MDCMYIIFRSAELALTTSPEDAVQIALRLRFKTQGKLTADGTVTNYDDRYQYAMDMIASSKWDKDITQELGPTTQVPPDRGHENVQMLPADEIKNSLDNFRSGDMVFFIKDPTRRVVGEIVGHIGILKREGREVFLIHASGRKNLEGKPSGHVKKLPFKSYAESMPFKGVIITRFN